ncbi:hypothetical protein D3C85_1354370 [compost metagenome]
MHVVEVAQRRPALQVLRRARQAVLADQRGCCIERTLDQHHALARERTVVEVGVGHDEGEVVAVADQVGLVPAHVEFHVQRRVQLEQPRKRGREVLRTHLVRCGDAQRAADLGAHRGGLRADLAQLVEQRRHTVIELLAALGHAHAPRGALEEAHAKLGFQPGNRCAGR